MNKKAIEEIAVNAVVDYFNLTERIAPYISNNDKEPVWDGNLYLYRNAQHTNEKLIGKIPVQVKGKECKDFKTNQKHSIEIVNLENYKRDGGVLFFVVQVKSNGEKKIFYNDLAPVRIKNILKNRKGGKTVSVKMEPLEDDKIDVEKKLYEFYWDCFRQKSFANKPAIPLEDFSKHKFEAITFHLENEQKDKIFHGESSHPVYLYAKTVEGIEIPLGDQKYTIRLAKNPQIIEKKISINEKLYYSKYIVGEDKNDHIITIGKSTTILCSKDKDDKTMRVKFNLKRGLLSDILNDSNFIIALHKYKHFQVDDVRFDFPDNNNDLSLFIKKMEYVKRIDKMLRALNVSKDLDTSSMSKEEEETLTLLLDSLEYDTPVKIDSDNTCMMPLKIGNINLLLYADKVGQGRFKLQDFFAGKFVISYQMGKKKKKRMTSHFTALRKEDFVKFDNIPFNSIVQSYEEMLPHNDDIFTRANYDMLEMLLASDELETKDKIKSNLILDGAKKLSIWLKDESKELETKNVHLINYYQVVVRERNFTDEEREALRDISASDLQNTIKASAFILLENKEMADYFLRKLTSEEMDVYKTYPIYNLYTRPELMHKK